MTNEQITQWAREVGMCAMSELAYTRFANPRQLHEFATLVRNATLEEAADVCEEEFNNWENERPLRIVATALRKLKS